MSLRVSHQMIQKVLVAGTGVLEFKAKGICEHEASWMQAPQKWSRGEAKAGGLLKPPSRNFKLPLARGKASLGQSG